MNIKKSLSIALAQTELSRNDIANRMGVTKQMISHWSTSGRMQTRRLDDLASALGYKTSEFIALGE